MKPKTKASDFSYAAVFAERDMSFRVSIVAPSVEELREAWSLISKGRLDLDETMIQRVQIKPMEFPQLRALQ